MINMNKKVIKWFVSLVLLMIFCGNPVTLAIFIIWFAWNCMSLFTN